MHRVYQKLYVAHLSCFTLSNPHLLNYLHRVAISLAMSRDGSSGGTIRLAVITKDNVDRIFIPGDKLPTFWEG